jgi:hypothetical protein
MARGGGHGRATGGGVGRTWEKERQEGEREEEVASWACNWAYHAMGSGATLPR